VAVRRPPRRPQRRLQHQDIRCAAPQVRARLRPWT
jgi:hypothetical protein